jgi:hypothetical protein
MEGPSRVTLRWMGSFDITMQLLQANLLLFVADASEPVSLQSLSTSVNLTVKQTADLLAPLF